MGASTALNVNLPAAIQSSVLSGEYAVEQLVCVPANAAVSLFTIAGGPCLASFYAVVSADIGGTAMNGTLEEVITTPANTMTFGTTVSCASLAAGTSIRWINTTGVLTPVTLGAVPIYPATVATLDCIFFCPIGTIKFLMTAANTGNFYFYMRYKPLSPACFVTAA